MKTSLLIILLPELWLIYVDRVCVSWASFPCWGVWRLRCRCDSLLYIYHYLHSSRISSCGILALMRCLAPSLPIRLEFSETLAKLGHFFKDIILISGPVTFEYPKYHTNYLVEEPEYVSNLDNWALIWIGSMHLYYEGCYSDRVLRIQCHSLRPRYIQWRVTCSDLGFGMFVDCFVASLFFNTIQVSIKKILIKYKLNIYPSDNFWRKKMKSFEFFFLRSL